MSCLYYRWIIVAQQQGRRDVKWHKYRTPSTTRHKGRTKIIIKWQSQWRISFTRKTQKKGKITQGLQQKSNIELSKDNKISQKWRLWDNIWQHLHLYNLQLKTQTERTCKQTYRDTWTYIMVKGRICCNQCDKGVVEKKVTWLVEIPLLRVAI